jgi:predicted DsbA family dithiol-disulfide isomerase
VAPSTPPIEVDVWSDVACPWCYIGKRNLETGMIAFTAGEHAVPIEIEYHSFRTGPGHAG